MPKMPSSTKMSEPLVCAILLVNGREAMVRRAVASFRAQSYENAILQMWVTGDPLLPTSEYPAHSQNICSWGGDAKSIGAMRNDAIAWTLDGPTPHPEIFCTWDSDDVSHPQRIAEQVALLQASGADCVGYYEAPFWDTRPGAFCGAWLYRDPARKHVLGASMCYWRKTWERRPFDDINHGEDTRFAGRCNTKAVSAITDLPKLWAIPPEFQSCDPRIVCGIHGANTSGGYDFTKRQQCFTQAPQFDDFCRERMAL